MYSNKTNVNILTSLLRSHDIRTAVVCPGSRNAPIVHNLVEAGMKCYAVTDERCAGFYAIGIALATGRPVVVCVTSGSAVLNVAPALAEAYYRRVGLVVISADRPASEIGHLQGQTLPQPGVFRSLAAASVDIPEPTDEKEADECARRVNEALMAAANAPVQINVPIAEPLFCFDVAALPVLAAPDRGELDSDDIEMARLVADRLHRARQPLIVIGQCPLSSYLDEAVELLSDRVPVLAESLADSVGGRPFDMAIGAMEDEEPYRPDFILSLGGNIVSKRLKQMLRRSDAVNWRIDDSGESPDMFGKLERVIRPEVSPDSFLVDVAYELELLDVNPDSKTFYKLWEDAIKGAYTRIFAYQPPYSQALAVKLFEDCLCTFDMSAPVHYANSSAVRLANLYSGHYNYVNRGVNGIEGSLSVAAGFSLVIPKTTFCVIGDLSFFYDSNALWCDSLGGNLRILLLNNGCGSIFETLPGLEKSPARFPYVAGTHRASARGVCESYRVEYHCAHNEDELRALLPKLFATTSGPRPILLEVFTDPHTDAISHP